MLASIFFASAVSSHLSSQEWYPPVPLKHVRENLWLLRDRLDPGVALRGIPLVDSYGPRGYPALLSILAEGDVKKSRVILGMLQKQVHNRSMFREAVVAQLSTGKESLVEYACVLIRDIGRPDDVDAVVKCLHHESVFVRKEAIKTILKLGDSRHVLPLQDFLTSEAAFKLYKAQYEEIEKLIGELAKRPPPKAK